MSSECTIQTSLETGSQQFSISSYREYLPTILNEWSYVIVHNQISWCDIVTLTGSKNLHGYIVVLYCFGVKGIP